LLTNELRRIAKGRVFFKSLILDWKEIA